MYNSIILEKETKYDSFLWQSMNKSGVKQTGNEIQTGRRKWQSDTTNTILQLQYSTTYKK